MFQSAPADCRREKGEDPLIAIDPVCFNPLPPMSAGEGWLGRQSEGAVPPFQSAPADCRREKPPTQLMRLHELTMFQSAPADCRREKPKEFDALQLDLRFNPLPPTCRREKQSKSPSTNYWTCFNPLPPTVGGRRVAATDF